ncbi:DNA polymerase-3 subunit beta [Rhodoligotrophos appendicifer]|uniref:DNA polymerase III subunit beta n=1 Tax=Rhodoligotrophos appendicifer TaxID=987056 RepID=UPI00117F1356|nr:DNA polymerase III subunit beta [Rhodoligotrophos appendicifer]
MKVTIERAAFLKALNHVQSVVERRNTIPILSNVLIHASEGEVRLSATDLDVEVVETVLADVAQAGATTAPAHMLYDIVRKLPDGSQLVIEQGPDNGRIAVVAGRSRFALQALPPEEFPDLTAGDFSNSFTLQAAELKKMIERTRFAISTEETRYYLNGIYLHAIEGEGGPKLRAVATDGHRLAQFELTLPAGAAAMPGVIIPRKTVLEVHRLLDDQNASVEISLSASKIRFGFDGIVLTSKLIDGTFPDYERVIPKHNDKVLEIDTKLFAQAVDRVSTISSEKGRAVKLHISSGRVVLTVNNPESGSAEEEVAADYDSEELDIGFNARYLLDIAGQFGGDNARMLLADAGSPTVIRDADDASALYVLMPMRV